MVRWLRWHCPPDTGFEIRTLAVWGRARYLSVTEAPHNTDFHTWMGKKQFIFLSNRRDREPNPELWRERQRLTKHPPAFWQLMLTHNNTIYNNVSKMHWWWGRGTTQIYFSYRDMRGHERTELILFNPLPAKLYNLNLHPFEVVSRWCDSQLQLSKSYSGLTKWRQSILKYCWFCLQDVRKLVFDVFIKM